MSDSYTVAEIASEVLLQANTQDIEKERK